MLQNVVLLMLFNVLRKRKTTSTFSEKPNAFLILVGAIFAFWAPELLKFDRFYKVICTTFLDAPNRSRTNAFSTFREVVKRHQLLVQT